MPSSKSLRDVMRQRVSSRPYLWVFTALLLWTLIVRLPFAHVIDDDEAFFSVIASRWLRGELPYVASFDVKAPGIFAVLAVFQWLFGASLAVIKGVEVLFTLWGAFALYRLLRQAGSELTALVVAGLYPLYSLVMMGVSSTCQLVEMAFTIEAMLQIVRADTGDKRQRIIRLTLSGLMIGFAIMTKQTAAFTAVGLFGWLALRSLQRREVLPLTAFCLGAVLPTVGFGLYFTLYGHFRDFLGAVVLGAWGRSQLDMSVPDHLGFLSRIVHFPAFFKPVLVISAGALLALLRLPRLKAALSPTLIALVLVWYLSAVVGILANRSPLIWYGSVLIAPTLILFGGVLCHGIDFNTRWRGVGIAVYLLVACVQPIIMARMNLFVTDYRGIPDYVANVAAGRSLQAHGLKAGDNLLVISRGHYVYLFTQTLPKAKYFNAMHLLCEFPTPDADPLKAAFDSNPKYILMADTSVMISCHKPELLAYARHRLNMDFIRVSHVGGVWDGFDIYQRRP